MSEVYVDLLPGGIRTASGGTRSAIGLNRPWQTDIIVDPKTCPFETSPQIEVASFSEDGGWRVIHNLHTPSPFHRLIIPKECWPKEQIRVLGGQRRILTAMTILQTLLSLERHELWFGVHVGPTAGQNTSHLHYHVLEPLDAANSAKDGEMVAFCKSSKLRLFENSALIGVAAGVRAGQCLFVPAENGGEFSQETAAALAAFLTRIIDLYADRYRSKQGLPPDYMVGIKLVRQRFVYGYFLPILNNWGFTEYFALFERAPLILPWSHADSLRLLKK